jgi:hypothetical protein
MNRLVLIALILSVALSACIPGFGPVSAGDSQATAIALAGTLAAQTMAALPSPTILPTNTPAPTVPPTATNTKTMAAPGTATFTPEAVNVTGTTTVSVPASETATSTSVVGSGTASPTDLMIPRSYGTQPPMVEYGRVRLINQSKTQVYISFQCTTPDNLYVVVEYPVGGTITVSVPTGKCHYVAWVGGRQFIGDIRIGRFEEFTFRFKKDRIIIQ